MADRIDTESIDGTGPTPVSITIESGGQCTVNMEISNAYNTYTYNYPDWFDQKLFMSVIDRLRG